MYNLNLVSAPNKILAIMQVRSILEKDLSEAIEIINNLPVSLFENLTLDEAKEIKARFEKCGCVVELSG